MIVKDKTMERSGMITAWSWQQFTWGTKAGKRSNLWRQNLFQRAYDQAMRTGQDTKEHVYVHRWMLNETSGNAPLNFKNMDDRANTFRITYEIMDMRKATKYWLAVDFAAKRLGGGVFGVRGFVQEENGDPIARLHLDHPPRNKNSRNPM